MLVPEKVLPLHPQLGTRVFNMQFNIGVWCNGNTTDSGPVILGSSPSTPTEEIAKLLKLKYLADFFCPKLACFIDAIRTVFVRGGTFPTIAHQVAALAAIASVMALWAVKSYKKNS